MTVTHSIFLPFMIEEDLEVLLIFVSSLKLKKINLTNSTVYFEQLGTDIKQYFKHNNPEEDQRVFRLLLF